MVYRDDSQHPVYRVTFVFDRAGSNLVSCALCGPGHYGSKRDSPIGVSIFRSKWVN